MKYGSTSHTSSRLTSASGEPKSPPRSASKVGAAEAAAIPAGLVDQVADQVTNRLAGVVGDQLAAALAAAGLVGGTVPPPTTAVQNQQPPGANLGAPTEQPAVGGAFSGGRSTPAEATAAAFAVPGVYVPAGPVTPPVAASPYGRDPIPHQDLAWYNPERVNKLQSKGLIVKTDLFSAEEVEKLAQGTRHLSKGQQAEFAYQLACDKRLDDVLAYVEAVSRGSAQLDLPRLHSVLGEIRDLGGERTDGLSRLGVIKDKQGEESETEASQLAAMDKDQNRRTHLAASSPLHTNKYQRAAVELQDAVDKKAQSLLAASHAYAQVKARYGAVVAQRAFAWAGTGAGGAGGGTDGQPSG